MLKTKVKKRPKKLKRTTRVTVDIPIEKHKHLKAVAALKGSTLQEFILTCVEEKMEEPSHKSKLEQLDDLGLLGAIEESEVSSTNYKEFIRNSVKKRHEK